MSKVATVSNTPPRQSSDMKESPTSSHRKSIFKNFLRRRSSSGSFSASSHTSSTLSAKPLDRNVSVRSTVSSSKRSLDGSVIDTEDMSIYNSDDDRNEVFEDQEANSSETSSIYSNLARNDSILSLGKNNIPTDSRSDELLESQLHSLLNAEGSYATWEDFKREALVVPKYVRPTRRNKNSPKILKRLFLAQELNAPTEENSDVESALDPLTINKSLDNVLYDKNPQPVNPIVGSRISKEIFVMRFSHDGKYLAVAGRDSVIKVWKVISSPLGRMEYNNYIGSKSPTKSSNKNHEDIVYEHGPVFHQEPVRIFRGHTNSILSIDWSKNNFLVSGSMDKTVKLWHIDKPSALATFLHEDFVTTVKFHPSDDRFFLSGSLDNQVRLWSILERSIAFGRHLGDDMLITASSFTPDGQHCVIGGFNGTLAVLEIKGLHVIQKFDIKRRELVPIKNTDGNKVTKITVFATNELDPGDTFESKWSFLITTNDSRIRLVNIRDKKLITRFKGSTNSGSIEASISDDHQYILSGSEDHWVYIWENNNRIINNKFKLALNDIVLEGKNHINDLQAKNKKYYNFVHKNKLLKKLNINQFLKEPNMDLISNENSSYTSFHAHHSKVNAAIFAPNSTKKLLELSDDLIFDLVKRARACQQFTEHAEFESIPEEEEIESGNEGMIVITTDEYGLIRVFRHDPAQVVRNAIIQLYKKAKAADKELNTCEDVKSMLGKRSPNQKLSPKISPTNSSQNLKPKLHSKFKNSDTSSDTSSIGRPELNKTSSLPLDVSRSHDNASKRPPSKSISNGLLGATNATLAIRTQVPVSETSPSFTRVLSHQTLEPINSLISGTITPDEEPSMPFPTIKISQSQSKVPLIINTQSGDPSRRVINFETPVNPQSSADELKDLKFTRIKKKKGKNN